MIKVNYKSYYPCPLDGNISCEKSEIYLEGENLSIYCNAQCHRFEFIKDNSDVKIVKKC